MKYPDHESITLEFKHEIPPDLRKIYRTVIGFANRFGGKIIIGVENSGVICGVPESHADRTLETLAKSIYESCSPPILPQVYFQRIQERTIVVIEVSPGNQKPYYLKSLGVNDGVFIRTGRSTIRATPELHDELAWASRGRSPDSRPIYNASVDDIDSSAFKHFLAQRHQQASKIPQLLALRNYGVLLQEHGQDLPTTGGILLFGKDPQKYLSEAFVIVTEYEGSKGRNVIATRDCTGTIFAQYSSAYEFILSKLNYSFVITARRRKDICEIPEVAIREILVNAIVHRNYQTAAPTKVSIYRDRIEIFSPGGFPGPLDPLNLKSGLTYIRNTIITRAFREVGLIQKLGSGFLTVFDSYLTADLPEPKIEGDAEFVKCILPRRGTTKKITISKQRTPTQPKKKKTVPRSSSPEANPLLSFIKNHTTFTAQDVVRALSISRQTAARNLTLLVEDGILERVGKGPNTRYLRKKRGT
jgi:ATP-dependent DNA helicase RecG